LHTHYIKTRPRSHMLSRSSQLLCAYVYTCVSSINLWRTFNLIHIYIYMRAYKCLLTCLLNLHHVGSSVYIRMCVYIFVYMSVIDIWHIHICIYTCAGIHICIHVCRMCAMLEAVDGDNAVRVHICMSSIHAMYIDAYIQVRSKIFVCTCVIDIWHVNICTYACVGIYICLHVCRMCAMLEAVEEDHAVYVQQCPVPISEKGLTGLFCVCMGLLCAKMGLFHVYFFFFGLHSAPCPHSRELLGRSLLNTCGSLLNTRGSLVCVCEFFPPSYL